MIAPYRIVFSIPMLLLTASLLSCKDNEVELTSRWRNSVIVVDGNAGEWAEAMTYLEKENLGYGVQNDQENLYICLQFDRARERQAMMFGFTIWFDSTAHDKKILGLRFPIGLQNYSDEWAPGPGMQEDMPQEGRPEPGDSDAEARRPGLERMQGRFDEMLGEVEVIGPDKDDRNRLPRGNTYGIEVALSDSASESVYELKIPLQSFAGKPSEGSSFESSALRMPYAVASQAGEQISLGFEMGELDRSKLRERMMGGGFPGGGRPGGGMGGGRPGGMGGRRPGGMGGGRPEMPEPIKVWTKVRLAER